MKTSWKPIRLAVWGMVSVLFPALCLPSPAAGQDFRSLQRQEAERLVQTISSDPENYQFQHVWKARVRAARAARARLERPGLSLSADELSRAGAAVTGTLNFPIIAGAFTDVPGPYTPEQYHQRIFGDGSGAVSARELYEEMSGGVFSVGGAVTTWVILSQDRAFYEPSASTDADYGRLLEFLTESLDGADLFVDFSQFDNDGPDNIPNSGDDDGIVDLAAFIYPTTAISCGGTGIWPHNWSYVAAQYFAGGIADFYYTNDVSASGGWILIGDYTIQSGLNCDGVDIMGSGTFSHELGHALDLPDLYDTDTSDGTDSEGIGEWGLMAGGGYNLQTSPAHLSAWSKDYLGWLNVQTLSGTQAGVILPPVQQTGTVYRVDLPSANEHFLLSNRQLFGSDQYLNGTGLLIWHIDSGIAGGADETDNSVNTNPYHKGVDLEEADGQDDLDWSLNRGDSGDPFPGSWNATEFHSLTYPSSQTYGGNQCGIGIRNITESAGNVTFDLSMGERWALWGDADGNGSLSTSDISSIYWYDMGYRDSEEQEAVTNGDVDGDGDVDLMDGFLLHSQLSGVTVPSSRIGLGGWTNCDLSGAPAQPAPAESVHRRIRPRR